MSFISPIPVDTNGQPRKTGSMQQLGRDDFLQLLVTKLKYQDPMNPMEDSAFIAQLAQFSTLEQMYNISSGIETSNKWDFLQMQSLNNVLASGLIGKEVKASYSGVFVDIGEPASIWYTADEAATEIKFTITDSEGNVIANLVQENTETGAGSIEWDGKDLRGNQVEEGYYNVSVTATGLSGSSFKPSLALIGMVDSIVYRDGAAFIRINGAEIPLGDITAVGRPGAFSDGDGDGDDGDGGDDG